MSQTRGLPTQRLHEIGSVDARLAPHPHRAEHPGERHAIGRVDVAAIEQGAEFRVKEALHHRVHGTDEDRMRRRAFGRRSAPACDPLPAQAQNLAVVGGAYPDADYGVLPREVRHSTAMKICFGRLVAGAEMSPGVATRHARVRAPRQGVGVELVRSKAYFWRSRRFSRRTTAENKAV